jgi:hypothetical protein
MKLRQHLLKKPDVLNLKGTPQSRLSLTNKVKTQLREKSGLPAASGSCEYYQFSSPEAFCDAA